VSVRWPWMTLKDATRGAHFFDGYPSTSKLRPTYTLNIMQKRQIFGYYIGLLDARSVQISVCNNRERVLLFTTAVEWKKRSEGTQRLRAGCSKVEPKISPRHGPLSGGAGRPKFNQLEMVTTFTYRSSLVRIDVSLRNFELSW